MKTQHRLLACARVPGTPQRHTAKFYSITKLQKNTLHLLT